MVAADGMLALHLAAMGLETDAASVLVAAGADPDAVNARSGKAAVHIATAIAGGARNSAQFVKGLADVGADLALQDSQGRTPAHYCAATAGQLLALAVIVQRVPAPALGIADAAGVTPLQAAVSVALGPVAGDAQRKAVGALALAGASNEGLSEEERAFVANECSVVEEADNDDA